MNTRVNSTSKDNSGMMVVTSHASVKTVCLVFTDATKGTAVISWLIRKVL